MTHTVHLPDVGEGIVQAELEEWLVAVGDVVTADTPVAEIMTDKASVQINSPISGTVAALLVAAGTTVTVGSPILVIEPATSLPAPAPTEEHPDTATWEPVEPPLVPGPQVQRPPAPGADPSAAPAGQGRVVLAPPTVRQRAKDLAIGLTTITGTGPGGRILMSDLTQPTAADGNMPTVAADRNLPIRGVRRVIALRLTEAWAAPHFTYVEQIDVTELEALRSQLNTTAAQHLTLVPLVARAVILGCRDHPNMNATFDAEHEMLTLHGNVHLGIATQTSRGLTVPVVRDADRRSMSDLAQAIRSSAESARLGTTTREQLTGSTITLTSLGALGGIMNTPILNVPEVAIIGVNRIRTEPRWNGANFVPRSVLNISASFDHRIVDGWDAAQFVQTIKQQIETPALLTLGWMP